MVTDYLGFKDIVNKEQMEKDMQPDRKRVAYSIRGLEVADIVHPQMAQV